MGITKDFEDGPFPSYSPDLDRIEAVQAEDGRTIAVNGDIIRLRADGDRLLAYAGSFPAPVCAVAPGLSDQKVIALVDNAFFEGE